MLLGLAEYQTYSQQSRSMSCHVMWVDMLNKWAAWCAAAAAAASAADGTFDRLYAVTNLHSILWTALISTKFKDITTAERTHLLWMAEPCILLSTGCMCAESKLQLPVVVSASSLRMSCFPFLERCAHLHHLPHPLIFHAQCNLSRLKVYQGRPWSLAHYLKPSRGRSHRTLYHIAREKQNLHRDGSRRAVWHNINQTNQRRL